MSSLQTADPVRALELLRAGHPLRVGRSAGRTIYVQTGEGPADGDLMIGIVDSPELARLIVDTVNYLASAP